MKQKQNIKIAILGYGSMGKEVEKIARAKSITVTDIFDIDKPIDIKKNYDFDIAIDFTYPDAVLENVKKLTMMNKKIVVGTTGWEKDFNKVKNLIEHSKGGMVYASNFSIGMQLFMNIVELAASQINNLDDYDIFMHEIHHKRKIDSPSGTALTLGNIILDKVQSKKKILTDMSNVSIPKESLHISSTRGGEIPGTHTVYIDSFADTLELTHRAKNRSGFALGAVEAALWIHTQQGFFDFRNIIKNILNS